MQKIQTIFPVPFSFYFGEAFTPPKSFCVDCAAFYEADFCEHLSSISEGAFCTASTFRLWRADIGA
jgi:hypothetical protein